MRLANPLEAQVARELDAVRSLHTDQLTIPADAPALAGVLAIDIRAATTADTELALATGLSAYNPGGMIGDGAASRTSRGDLPHARTRASPVCSARSGWESARIARRSPERPAMLPPHLQAHFVHATYSDRLRRRRRWSR
jgi:hypothetical protein